MSTRPAPNPHSPYADADPDVRHLFPNPTFFPDPTPGGLLPAACGGMAVVPTEPLHVTLDEHLPEGLCPACVAQVRGHPPAPSKPPADCRECDTLTRHADLCALCRQDKHDAWWATRQTTDTEETTDV